MRRPRPVLIINMIGAGLAAIASFGGLAELIPETAVKWILLVTAVYMATGAVHLQGVVTPLKSPQDELGNPLISSEK